MLLAQYGTGNELGELVHESDEKPWETKKPTSLTDNDIPKDLSIVRANQLYVPRAHLTARAENAIKRLAAFPNPDFYRAQAMRLPIYNTALTESITYLRSYCIQVKTRDNLFLRCAVIDSEIVWYGSANVLSYSSCEACIMRLENSKIAAQLLDSVMKEGSSAAMQ